MFPFSCGTRLLTGNQFYGRRPIYLVAFTLFVIWLIPCAVATNIAPILISRFCTGLLGSPLLSISGGTVADMFDRYELSPPMMIFTAAPFIGKFKTSQFP